MYRRTKGWHFLNPGDSGGECCDWEFHRSERILSMGSYECMMVSFLGLDELNISFVRRASN